MPSPPRPNPPAHTARLAIAGAYGNARWANVFWARNGSQSQPNANDLGYFATQFYAEYAQAFKGHLQVAVVIEGCQLLYYGAGGSVVGSEHIQNTNGTDSGFTLPASATICISWHIPERYRGGHPRTYLPPPGQNVLSDGQHYTPAFAENVRISANQFLLGVNGISSGALGDVHLGTVSFVHARAWRTPPVFRDYTPAAAQVDTRIDTQRRRLGPDI